MNYSARNPFYLRISKNTVLPIYVYLDDRHIHWMSDTILQHVLSDLRPNILPKLKAEADIFSSASTQKRATVDTHRGDTYQFCYFIRKTEPHSILVKSRKFTVAPLPKSIPKPSQSKTKQRKRKEAGGESPSTPTRSKRRRTARRSSSDGLIGDEVEMDDTAADIAADEDEYVPDPECDNIDHEREDVIEIEIEDEEEKPKPILGLTYQGFNIYGHCLCIVVEPWPPVRSMTLGPSLGSQLTTQTTLQTKTSESSIPKTPLFLPEEPDVEERPRPSAETRPHVNQAYLKKVLDPDDVTDDEDNMGGMMEFSQVLYNIGDSRAGAINDDDDMDGSILFGDADEFKEL